MRPGRWWVSGALAVSGWVALTVSELPVPLAARSLAIFGFALACPGLAVLGNFRWPEPLEYAVWSVALSFSLATLLSVAEAVTGWWEPTATVVVLAVVTTAAALLWGHIDPNEAGATE